MAITGRRRYNIAIYPSEVDMGKPKVFVTRLIADEALDKVREATDMKLWEDDLPTPRDVLLREVRDIDGLLCLLTERIDAELFDAGPNLKVVSNMAVGFDNIDLEEATRRGIPVGNTPRVLTETTADFAFALIMAAGRRVVEGDRYTRAGKWKTWGPKVLLGQDIHGSTLGIIGLGRIGLEMAKRAQGFSMRVIYYDAVVRNEKAEREYGLEFYPDMMKVLAEADFVTLHVPLNPETRHLIGAKELDAMKPTASLVNTSRGPVVDPKALYQALKGDVIASAALDVTEVEPIPMDDPLLTLENCIVAPHIASSSVATRTKMGLMAAENLLAGLRGEQPPDCPNPEAMQVRRRS
ncbi:MAG: 2-hydroxyacid dehydrogenase [Dehalococcoidia bacterium]